MEIVKWQDCNILTGDNVLCSGEGAFSQAIKFWNGVHGVKGLAGEMTHVGKFFKHRGKLWIWESTVTGMNGKKGVMCNPFEPWFDKYKGEVYVQAVRMAWQLLKYHNSCTDLRYRDSFQDFRMKHYGTPYVSGVEGLVRLMGAHDPGELAKEYTAKHEVSGVFCGQAIAGDDQYCGRLNNDRLAKDYPPSAFVDGTYGDNLIGCKAMDLVEIK